MGLKETELVVMDWINLAQDRKKQQSLVNIVIILQFPCGQFVD
jgi:hypothetical protein